MPKAREWLASDAAKGLRIAHFDGDEWAFILPNSALRPDDILVFATSVDQDAVRDLLQGCSNVEDASCDVFDGVSRLAPKYRRQVEFSSGAEWTLLKKDGTQRFARTSDLKKAAADEESLATIDDERWRPAKSAILRGELSGTAATIRYWSRKRSEQRGQLLSLHETAARDAGTALAAALSPDDGFLGALLPEAGALHDEGKNYPPWQRAMGNDDPAAPPIAKPKRELEHPASTHGYRHEWGSLLATEGRPHAVLHEWADTAGTLWLDLRQHLIGAHHGHLRPSFPDKAFRRDRPSSKQVALRLEAVERSARLQTLVGPWRLAYLESLLKTIDVEASRRDFEDEMEETDER
jgi:CRISPR-associated helicase Cas3